MQRPCVLVTYYSVNKNFSLVYNSGVPSVGHAPLKNSPRPERLKHLPKITQPSLEATGIESPADFLHVFLVSGWPARLGWPLTSVAWLGEGWLQAGLTGCCDVSAWASSQSAGWARGEGDLYQGSWALARDYFHCVLLARASQGTRKRPHLLVGGAIKDTDIRKGETLGLFLQSTWKRLMSNFTMEFRALKGLGL